MNEYKNELKPRIDYDGFWKRLILTFFEEFLDFFLPNLLLDVDLNKPPEFLEQELATIIPKQTAKGRMSVDKLLKFWTKNGEDKHIFVHIEVQSSRELGFTERAFKYFYRIYDKNGKLITTIAIYTHDDVPDKYDRFEYNYQGTELTYKFNTYLVRDADEKKLEASDNMFALVILACKYANYTQNDVELRRKFKLKLFRLAITRGYSREEIEALVSFIDFVVYLPPKMNTKLKVDFVKEFKKEKEDMEKNYIVSPTFDEILLELMSDKQKKEIAVAKKAAEKAAKITAEKAAKITAEKAMKIAMRAEIKKQRKKAIEEQRKAIEEQRKAIEEEQRKAAEEQRKAIEEEQRKAAEEQRKAIEEEQRKAAEEQRKAAEEQRKAIEEQRKAAEEQRKARLESVRKLIISGVFDLSEIVEITGIPMEEVLKVKAKIGEQG